MLNSDFPLFISTYLFMLNPHSSFSPLPNGNPLQCSCLENPREGEPGWAAVYGVTQSQTRLKRLSSSSSSIQVPGRHTHLGQGLGSIQPTTLRDSQLTRLKLSQSCSVVRDLYT